MFITDLTVVCSFIVILSAATITIVKSIRGAITELDERIKRHTDPIAAQLEGHKAACENEFAFIRSELSYNGGSSTKDFARKSSTDIQSIKDELNQQHDRRHIT